MPSIELRGTFYLLHEAVNNGDLKCVRVLLANGASSRCVNSYHDTPLMIACQLGYLFLMPTLIEDYVRPSDPVCLNYYTLDYCNRDGYRAIELTVLHGHVDCLEASINAGA